jgi:hypothetical protein
MSNTSLFLLFLGCTFSKRKGGVFKMRLADATNKDIFGLLSRQRIHQTTKFQVFLYGF